MVLLVLFLGSMLGRGCGGSTHLHQTYTAVVDVVVVALVVVVSFMWLL